MQSDTIYHDQLASWVFCESYTVQPILINQAWCYTSNSQENFGAAAAVPWAYCNWSLNTGVCNTVCKLACARNASATSVIWGIADYRYSLGILLLLLYIKTSNREVLFSQFLVVFRWPLLSTTSELCLDVIILKRSIFVCLSEPKRSTLPTQSFMVLIVQGRVGYASLLIATGRVTSQGKPGKPIFTRPRQLDLALRFNLTLPIDEELEFRGEPFKPDASDGRRLTFCAWKLL
jgi:hypothetical protein